MSSGTGAAGGLHRPSEFIFGTVLVLILAVAAWSWSPSRNWIKTQWNHGRANDQAEAFYREFSVATPLTEAQWGLCEFTVYGRNRFSRLVAGGLADDKDIADQPGKVLVTLPFWCRGKDASGNQVRQCRDLCLTMARPSEGAKFEVLSWEFQNIRPLTRLRQVLTCTLWCIGLTVVLVATWRSSAGAALTVVVDLQGKIRYTRGKLYATVSRLVFILVNFFLVGYVCHVCFPSWFPIVIGFVLGCLIYRQVYIVEPKIVTGDTPTTRADSPRADDFAAKAKVLQAFLRGDRDAVIGAGPSEPAITHPWAQTPYQDLEPLLPATENPPKDFDLFVSYKSHDVDLARRTADILIASGLRVWFAEYGILLAGRSEFKEAIKAGIRRSEFGLAFSNGRYVASEYCRLELGELLAPGNCGATRILHVPLGEDNLTLQTFPQVAGCPTIPFRGEINEVLRGVQRLTSMPIERASPAPAAVETVVSPLGDGNGYALDVAGWELVRRGGRGTPFGIEGPAGRRTKNGCETRWNLVVGPMVTGSTPVPDGSEASDDRKLYELMVKFSDYFAYTHKARCTGVHLLHLGGRGQLALTYWWSRDNYWTRRYSIILPYPQTGRSTEFAFTFAFFGPFREYCRQVWEMDRLVQSLDWRPVD